MTGFSMLEGLCRCAFVLLIVCRGREKSDVYCSENELLECSRISVVAAFFMGVTVALRLEIKISVTKKAHIWVGGKL